jgi:hypothetical protein
MKQVLLRLLIASVIVNAIAGVAVLLQGDLGAQEARVVGTTATITAATLLFMPCIALFESRRAMVAPLAGSLVIPIAAAMVVAGVWLDDPSGNYWRTTGSLVTAGVALAYVCLLELPRLEEGLLWIRYLASGLAIVFALEVLAAVWSEYPGETGARVLGITAILLTAATVLVPILQRTRAPTRVQWRGALAFCPACGAALREAAQEARCRSCGARFRVEFLP